MGCRKGVESGPRIPRNWALPTHPKSAFGQRIGAMGCVCACLGSYAKCDDGTAGYSIDRGIAVTYVFSMTRQVTVEFPEEAMKTLDVRPEQLPQELREAAVLRWFEEGRVSQGQAACLLGVTRGEFFDLLNAHHLSPVQMTAADLEEDFRHG